MTRLILSIAAIVAVSCCPQLAMGAPVEGPWTNAVGFGDGPIAGADTASPIVGDGTANSASQEMIDSAFPPITLANAGDKIIFTGDVTLTGTVNSPHTSGTPRTQFRFGLFKDEDGSDDLGWIGYYMSNKHGNPGTPSGVLAAKPVGNTSAYLAVGGQTLLTSQQGDGTTASLFNDDTYSMNLTIERNAVGELLVLSSLTGALGFSQVLSSTDATAATTGTYTFDHLGFLLGMNLGADQAAFSNLDVSFVPASAGITGDYNNNGIVDAADYVLWRESLATQTPLANDPIGLPIDQDQYEQWKANFGRPGPASSLVQNLAVPEPASVWLLLASVLFAWLPRRR